MPEMNGVGASADKKRAGIGVGIENAGMRSKSVIAQLTQKDRPKARPSGKRNVPHTQVRPLRRPWAG